MITDENSKTILIVDDDSEIRKLLTTYLQQNGFVAYQAGDGREMDQQLAEQTIDLIILDLMLPGEDGLEICRRLHASSEIPIIMLTARGDDTDRIVGLEMGADDYLPKPFNPRELLARIRVVLRRLDKTSKLELEEVLSYQFSDWTLDVRNRHLITPDHLVVPLSGAEFRLLQIFLDRPHRVLSRDQVMDLIQGRETLPFDRSIDVQVSRLRQKLNDSGKDPQFIKTVRGEGYLFASAVTRGQQTP